MNDLISRNMAIKAIEDLPNCYNGFSDTFDKACIIGVLEELAPVDAIQVVRCKDCKFLRFTGTVWKCQNRLVMMLCEPNDYCSRAERKEE